MVSEEEKYKEDENQRLRIAARNQLEAYIFQLKQAMQDYSDKLSPSDQSTVEDQCSECLRWLDNNSLAEKQEFDDKQKELTRVCSLIMSKLYTGSSVTNIQEKCQVEIVGNKQEGLLIVREDQELKKLTKL